MKTEPMGLSSLHRENFLFATKPFEPRLPLHLPPNIGCACRHSTESLCLW